eukprot:CAMPEP_0172919848 /NCGR_PEP_ID=MMETSP1075-20121228/202908_1 /TAXON_ID=2916 /ORGANISM="Ceratium fusus, Strain PA161109" /LENGTH=41 /DNA_ID= /DNA_START= /DNA_END= /DNA_ORIENTATION=
MSLEQGMGAKPLPLDASKESQSCKSIHAAAAPAAARKFLRL